MKKQFLLALPSLAAYLVGNILFAQTTGTFIVADKGNRAYSCVDSLLHMTSIYNMVGLKDLNDPNDNPSNYRILKLQGSVITNDEITEPFAFSAYSQIYVEKKNTTFNGHNGLVIYTGLLQRPSTFFKNDTLKPYTVEKGATVSFSQDFFNNFEYWESGYDTETLQNRIIFVDEQNHISEPIGSHWVVGKGTYKVKVKAAVCGPNDLMWDSVYVIVKETPCLRLDIKDLPSVCSDDVIDITPYIQLDGGFASVSQLAEMSFKDKSNINPAANGVLDPHAINIGQMLNKTDKSPALEISYQPNVAQGAGVCAAYFYRFAHRVPTKYIMTNLVFLKDNSNRMVYYEIDGEYFGFNNSFNKQFFRTMFLDYYNVFSGTLLNFYSESQPKTEVVGSVLSPGNYTIKATNPNCEADTSTFKVTIKNRDFDITWKSATAIGKGYFTFTAPDYPNATYSWFAYGGSVVSGLGTKEIVVYYSESASPAVTVSCEITLPASPNARLEEGEVKEKSSLYLDVKAVKTIDQLLVLNTPQEQTLATSSSSVYPNPGRGSFTISGTGTYDLKVYNSLGQLVHQETSYEANSALILDTKGMHFVYLIQNENRQILKVMVQ